MLANETNKLEKYREEIDKIDNKLVKLLFKRIKLVKKIGKYKKENKLSIYDQKRWHEVIEQRTKKAAKLGLDKAFVKKLFSTVHQFSQKTQKKQ